MTIHQSDSSSSSSSNTMVVVSIECLKGGSTADMLQTGDIVEEILFGAGHSPLRAPFKGGRAGLQRVLHASFKSKDTVNILVRVRRGCNSFAELKAYIFPNESAGKKQYMLRAVDDPNYAVGFLDRTESECFALPSFLRLQISGGKASCTVSAGSLSDLSNLANTSLYGFEDYHGVDIGVVRAVRLWYSSIGEEIPVEIKLKEGDTKLGFAISRTEEGFIYISSVMDGDENAPSSRSGLRSLHKEAMKASKLLVVSRLGNQKILPWTTSSTGAIRCFDTVSLSQKLSLHRHAKVSITIHVFLWERAAEDQVAGTAVVERGSGDEDFSLSINDIIEKLTMLENSLDRDTDHSVEEENNNAIGEESFRFHNFVLPNNWV